MDGAAVSFAFAFAAALALTPPSRAIVVSSTSPVATVTAALALAHDGDTIIVRGGSYHEPTIVVSKRVTLLGERLPVLEGSGPHGILLITADDVTVRGFVLRDVAPAFVEDPAAIRVENARGCSIDHNRIENAFFGIYLARVNDCRVADNVIRASGTRETESGNGIHLWTSRRITIERNDVRGLRDGIYFEFVHDSDVRHNTSADNLRYGLHFMYSDACRYVGNTFRHNGSGVAVMYTKVVTMRGNRFEQNAGAAAYGLLLKEISDARLENNHFVDNTVALFADGANRIQAVHNQFVGNGWAVRLDASTVGGRFEKNTFIRNTFDIATNSRAPSTVFDGNYWDEYRGYDLDRDGVGDVPFRPVRLFSVIVEDKPMSLILARSTFAALLDASERAIPSLTPERVMDTHPAMRPWP
jgi:nitrous oxidase accessory protein